MATSEFWQRVSATPPSSTQEWNETGSAKHSRTARGSAGMWMTLDAFTVIGAAFVASLIQTHANPLVELKAYAHGRLFHGESTALLTALLLGFAATLIVISRSLHLYQPTRLTNHLHEQRLSFQACLTSGLLLTGTLYLIRGEAVPRGIVLLTVLLLMVSLSLRRFVFSGLSLPAFRARNEHAQRHHRWHWRGSSRPATSSAKHSAVGLHL